ncbi:MAG: SRPBCC family protein [Cytophagaceae bacterium]
MKTRTLKRTIFLNKPIEEVFDFFSRPENLNVLTPPHLRFKNNKPWPLVIETGTLIEYQIKLYGIPIKWLTKITNFEENRKFTDIQVKGPYLLWEHQHIFVSKNNGTEMTDIIRYKVPGFFLEPIIFHLVVNRDLKSIFKFREEKCKELFC